MKGLEQRHSDTDEAVAKLDLAIERAELVHALSRISDRIYELKQLNSPPPALELLERTERALQKRLNDLREKSSR